MRDDDVLRSAFPTIPWDEPVLITVPTLGSRWACRLCIAQLGFSPARNWDSLYETTEGAQAHLTAEHPRTYRTVTGKVLREPR